jgi:short-chain fatty acids transporter
VSGGLLILGPLLFWAMTPRKGEDPDPRPAPEQVLEVPAVQDDEKPPADAIERIERSRLVTMALVLPMAGALGLFLGRQGIGRLDLNTVNLTLWCLAMIAHGRPHRFLAACEEGIRGCTGVLLQFPLYAGIMGMMTASGLSTMLSMWFVEAGRELLPVVTFLSAGLVNVLVPSGGGQWAIQGPILVEAALRVGVPVDRVLMALAYGDQWTNMIQPFWALPLLAITGVRARDIIGYCVIWMGLGGLWIAAHLLLAG